MRLRTVFFTTHLWLGLSAGAFIALLGATGAIMAFEPEIEHALHPHLWYVTAPPGTHALTLAQIRSAVTRAFPSDSITAYQVSTKPGLSYQVGLSRSQVFVNQYSGQLLGRVRFGGGPDLLNVIHQLHTHLLWRGRGDVGKKVVTGAALMLLWMLLSGAYLWWPLKRLSISWRGAGARRSWFDLHNSTGILTLAFLLVLCASGLVMGFEQTSTRLFYQVTGSQPAPRPDLHIPIPSGHVQLGPDSAFAIARAALPGALPFEADVPARDEAYFVRARFPEDRTPGGRSQVVIDSYTGRVLFAQGSRTAPAGARAVIANRAIHTGDILGVPGKALVSLASIAAVVQVVTGLLMWLRRSQREG